MDTAGSADGRTLEVWREARRWWDGEPYVERRKVVDGKGIRRIEEKKGCTLGVIKSAAPKPYAEDSTEEISLRIAKTRDEKVRAACGAMSEEFYERASAERKGETLPPSVVAVPSSHPYAPLHLYSGYAYGRSVMLAEEVAGHASRAGCPAAAIADPFSLVGCFEFAMACRGVGVKPLIGASIELPEGGELVLIARNRTGYRSLSRLVTACHLGEPRCFPLANWDRLREHSEGLLCLTGGYSGPLDRLLTRNDRDGALHLVERLISLYGRENVFLEIERSFQPWRGVIESLTRDLAHATGTAMVAGGGIGLSRRSDYPAQDVLLCAESLCKIEDTYGRKPRRHEFQPFVARHPERGLNAERFLRSGEEMAILFADRPELLANTLRVADRCEEDVLPKRQGLPRLYEDDAHALAEIVDAEAHFAYGADMSPKHKARLKHEVGRIQRMGFSSHFLVAWDFCRFARDQAVGMSGRGSVIDSAVAYVLGFSRIDAIAHNLHFDRFLPEDGSKRPDIDIDFEAKRRDDVRGYVIRKYGKDRVAGLAAIGSYRARGIVRDVGKVFGLPDDMIGFLAKRIHGGVSADQLEAALDGRPELRDSPIPRDTFRWVFELSQRLMDVPTGNGLHSSGVIVSAEPLADTVPVQWSASPSAPEAATGEEFLRQIQWDKRTAKRCFDKFDILCLRGQDVLSGVEARVRASVKDFSSERLAAVTDKHVYEAMQSGELIGVPQSASPAMRQAHQRLQTKNLHEASLVQAGIRPGVGGAVKLNELIQRHRGKPFEFEHPDFEEILGNTYGIIVFQEQVDQILQTFCGYTSGGAEDIRDDMYKKRRDGYAERARDEIVRKALGRGYPQSVAEHVFELVSQFKGYGFAQGHALAFAEVSLRSVYLMQNHPGAYFAALLSAQPAGYYGPATIANEARSRGLAILPLDVNRSGEKFETEAARDPATGLSAPDGGIRVGLMQLAGLSKPTRDRMLACLKLSAEAVEERPHSPLTASMESGGGTATAVRGGGRQPAGRLLAFGSLPDFAAKVRPSRDELESLVLVGAFDSLNPNRRALLWTVKAALEYARMLNPDGTETALPLDFGEPAVPEGIADFSVQEKAAFERALLGMDVERHLMAFERERVRERKGFTTQEARRLPTGTKAFVVGNPIRLRFPPTQSGKRVCFFDLEDETGLLNCTAFDAVYQRCGHAIVTSQYCTVRGTVQDRDGHAAFLVSHVLPYEPVLLRGEMELPVGRADFLVS